MIVIMTSCAHCHTIIHIQSYNHTHTSIHIQSCNDVAHGYMKHSHEKLCCTYPWSLRLHRCSSADWLLDLWSLRLPPVQFTGVMEGSLVSAPATCSLPNRLSNLLPLRVRPGSWPGRFLKCWCLHLPPLEFRGLIVRSLASAPATRAVYQSDGWILGLCAAPATWQFTRLIFKMWVSAAAIGGFSRLIVAVQFPRVMVGSSCMLVLCACHLCNWPNWFSNCWSLRPPSVQFTKLILKNVAVCSYVRLPPVQWSGLIVRFLVSAPVNCAVYQSDGWILGLGTCHPCSTRSRVRFCVSPCHLCRRLSLNPRRRDVRYITSGFGAVILL